MNMPLYPHYNIQLPSEEIHLDAVPEQTAAVSVVAVVDFKIASWALYFKESMKLYKISNTKIKKSRPEVFK